MKGDSDAVAGRPPEGSGRVDGGRLEAEAPMDRASPLPDAAASRGHRHTMGPTSQGRSATPESRWPLRGPNRPRPRHAPGSAGPCLPGGTGAPGRSVVRRRGARKVRPVPASPSEGRRGPSLGRTAAGLRRGEHWNDERSTVQTDDTTRRCSAPGPTNWPITISFSPKSGFGVNSRCPTLIRSIPVVRRRARVGQPRQRVS